MPARRVTAAAHDQSKHVYTPRIVTTSCCKWLISMNKTDRGDCCGAHSGKMTTDGRGTLPTPRDTLSCFCCFCCCCCCAQEVYRSQAEAGFSERSQPSPTNIWGMSQSCSLLPLSSVSVFISPLKCPFWLQAQQLSSFRLTVKVTGNQVSLCFCSSLSVFACVCTDLRPKRKKNLSEL